MATTWLTYPVRFNTLFNLVLLQPDNDNLGGDHEEAEPCIQTEMLERYKEWCPTPQNLLPDESVMECALDSHNFLPAWHENKVVLRGNSWHRVITYVAQDAVQAIEGAGVLQVALAKLATDSTLAIEVWE